MNHDLKTWPQFFSSILSGEKTFELRNDDRNFQVGDTLTLREWCPADFQYTGREIKKCVTHLLRYDPQVGCAASFGLRPGYVILSISNAE